MRIICMLIIAGLFCCAGQTETKTESVVDSVKPYSNEYSDISSEDLKEDTTILYDTIILLNCEHKNLSAGFDIAVYVQKYIDTTEGHVSSKVKLLLSDKKSKITFDSIELSSAFYYGTIFQDCKNVMSYSTAFNKNRKTVDNNYGDIVIADLNFDNREDIAVINDMGGNGGPLYSFFIQDTDRTFSKDVFLTDSMEFFPSKINKAAKTLTTYVHAGVCGSGEHIYRFDSGQKSWKEISHTIIDICK